MINRTKKSILTLFLIALCLLISLPFSTISASATAQKAVQDYSFGVPYETVTMGPNNSLVATQTAYLPTGRINSGSSEKSLYNPEDMAVDRQTNKIYIADTGNKRIVIVSLQGEYIGEFGAGTLSQPMGLAINNGKLFVCDKANKLVYVYSLENLELVKTIGRPDSPLVGKNTPYAPMKITVDSRGNMYVVSEGCASGLMQINAEGEFVGYVGANITKASFASALQNLFFSEEQKNAFLATPKSPTNVTIDSRGLVYTVTNNSPSEVVKKLNTLGNSIMTFAFDFLSATTAASVDLSGNIYTVQSDQTGGSYVTVFSGEGNLLFRFGGKDSYERFGSLSNPVAVKALPDGRVMILDKNYSMIVVYERTEFARLVFNAVDYYKDGLYLEGEELWKDILRFNSNFILAYRALAMANMKRCNYSTALNQFKYAEDRQGYSEAYWQIRNEWLENNLLWVIILVIIAILTVTIIKFIDRKNVRIFKPVKDFFKKIGAFNVKNVYFFNELGHAKRFLKSTPDAVYEVKYHKKASVWTALILFAWFIILQILGVVLTGYLFNSATVYNTDGWNMVLVTIGVFLALVACNYFVSTVTDGDGKILECFVCFIYALTPYLIMALPIYILSNFLTFNEQVIYAFAEIVMYGWSSICIFRAIGELHDYSFGKTIKNIFLTIFAFAMLLLFIIIIRMLFMQLFGYIGSIIGEVIN